MEPFANLPEAVVAALRRKGPEDRIVILGASTSPDKYGNKIVKNLVGKGYAVVPVNPKEPEVEGLVAYRSVPEVKGPVAIVNFVVPPAVSKKVLETMRDLDVAAVWFQDGSFDAETIRLAREHFTNVVFDACIMVVTNLV